MTGIPKDYRHPAGQATVDDLSQLDHGRALRIGGGRGIGPEHDRHELTVTEIDFGAFRSLSATLCLAITLAVAVGTRKTA